MNSNRLMDYYFGDDITSLGEDLLVNLIDLVDVEVNLLKLCVLKTPAQDIVDLKFSFLALTGAPCVRKSYPVGKSYPVRKSCPARKSYQVRKVIQ